MDEEKVVTKNRAGNPAAILVIGIMFVAGVGGSWILAHRSDNSVDASVIAAQNCVPGPGEKCPTAEWLDHYNEYFTQARTIVQMEHDPVVKKLTDAQFQLNGLADWLNDPKNTPPGYTFDRQKGKLIQVAQPPAAAAPPPAAPPQK
jgi:hypothetical protein